MRHRIAAMSRRDQIKMTRDEVDALLAEEKTVVVATNGPRGWPHLMPLWYVLRPTGPQGANEVWAWTFAKSQKARNLERDTRASAQVEAGEEYHLLRGVLLECDVVVHRDVETVAGIGLDVFRRSTATGGDLAPEVEAMVRKQAPKRVGLQFVERRRATWDHRKLGAGSY
jgi:general stress protein 26